MRNYNKCQRIGSLKYAKFMQKETSSTEKLMIGDFSLNSKRKLRPDLEYIMLRTLVYREKNPTSMFV